MSAEAIHSTLSRLMQAVHDDPRLTAEIARAEREFFHANPRAQQEDASAPFRFREWYLLERASEVLGDVPLVAMPMQEAEREALSDSLVGVFLIAERRDREYVIRDLQGDAVHDLEPVATTEFSPGDVLIGRLFEGSLDTYIASPALACQRDAHDLAAAFRHDLARLSLDRRLTQAELEHLLFRGRGNGAADHEPQEAAVPLEHLEADLERVLVQGGIDADELSATAISASLRGIPRPGLVADPLLEHLAFDSAVDIEAAQRLLLDIWNHHRTHPGPAQAEPPMHAEPPTQAEPAPPPERPAQVPAPQRETRTPPPRAGDRAPGLGADIAARIERGLAAHEDLSAVFADVDDMVGAPADDAGDEDELPVFGNLRPLITEYLWETGREQGPDVEVLEQLVRMLGDGAAPRPDVEALTRTDLVRVLVRTFLGQPPGARSAAVGQMFAGLRRFLSWVEATQGVPTAEMLGAAEADVVEHAARLELAAVALSGPDDAGERVALRVAALRDGAVEVVREATGDDPLLVPVDSETGANLRVGDLLLGALEIGREGSATFAGMVVALPAAARDALG